MIFFDSKHNVFRTVGPSSGKNKVKEFLEVVILSVSKTEEFFLVLLWVV